MKMDRLLLLLAFSASFSLLFAQNEAKSDSKKSPAPFLGVATDDGSELEEGLLIEGVYRGFGAEAAGLQRGDILLAVNGDDVNSTRELNLELKSYRAGDEVELTFRRFNKEMKARAKLSDKPKYADALSVVRRGESDGKKTSGKKAFMGIYPTTDWQKGGVRITGFTQKSQAWRAGLEEGDVITRLDEAQISTFDELNNYLFEKAAGQEMQVVFLRNGKEKSLKMTLGETDDCSDSDSKSYGWNDRDAGDWADRMEEIGERMAEEGSRIGERLGREGEELAEKIENRMANRRRPTDRREWEENFFSLRDFSAILSPGGNLTVSFSGRSNQAFSVVVADEDGRELAREERDELAEGLFTQQFDLSKAAAGVFYVRVLKGDDVVASSKVEKN